MANIIDVTDLVEVYADGTKAVDGVSFSVEEGQFFGFLGPNGAGKSTTIKVLTTLLKKTSGKATVAGFDVDSQAEEIRKVIGVQSQETVLDNDLTGRENLVLQGQLQRMGGSELKTRVDDLLSLVGLTDVAERRAGHYSGGMRKRLDLASALVHRPKLLFLDEPTTGLDPQSRAAIWEYLAKLNKEQSMTIFLTTQYMEEADRLCKQLYIIDHGKIVANGSPSELKSQVGADSIKLSLQDGVAGELNQKAKGILEGMSGVNSVVVSDDGLTVYARNAGLIIADIVRAFDSNRIQLAGVSFSSPTLDDVFLQHTGRRIRPEELNTKQSATSMRFGARRPTRQ
ncbi:MAG TPA: ATP-binding cassette domain-containing protein [Nitrososphaerales archaeon]|nr:ATP-binding cassette domain-containing protein [Nitrososphaerales archaeon]